VEARKVVAAVDSEFFRCLQIILTRQHFDLCTDIRRSRG
jgi:hypothetical protein